MPHRRDQSCEIERGRQKSDAGKGESKKEQDYTANSRPAASRETTRPFRARRRAKRTRRLPPRFSLDIRAAKAAAQGDRCCAEDHDQSSKDESRTQLLARPATCWGLLADDGGLGRLSSGAGGGYCSGRRNIRSIEAFL